MAPLMVSELSLSAASRRIRKIADLQFTAHSVPFALFILCVLAYGLLVQKLGFYWDDWPWIWRTHINGPGGMLSIDQGYRPLAGVILWLGAVVAGKSPIAWQSLNIIFRFFSGLTLWWMLSKLWPEHQERSVWVALTFLVYPGFGQQYVSVNSSRHIFPLATLFLSIGFMIWAIRNKRHYWLFTGIALQFTVVSLLTTDYYFGLELIKPAVLWLVLDSVTGKPLERLKHTVKYWLPYLFVLLILIVWRYFVSLQINYAVVIIGNFIDHPASTTVESITLLIKHAFSSGVIAWLKAFAFPHVPDVRLRRAVLYWAVLPITFLATFIYLLKFHRDNPSNRITKQAIGLGLFSLLVAGLPFLAAGIPKGLNFPADRTTLPMMLGASLLLVGVVDLFPNRRPIKVLVISFMVCIATAAQVMTAISYENDWKEQKSFFQQLVVRAPGLKKNTIVVYEHTPALQISHSSDNSFVAALNWIYAPKLRAESLPYYIYDLRLRSNSILPLLQDGRQILSQYGTFQFVGLSDQVLMVQYAPPWCLQVLQPEYEGLYPHLPDHIAHSVHLSSLDVIDLNPATPASLPEEIFGEDTPQDWCYYFQLADLASQRRDWQEVAEIGDRAFQLIDPPKQPSERLPFIQGYGYVGRWEQAEELTFATLKRDKNTQPMLCSLWAELVQNTPESSEKDKVLERITPKLNCEEND